MFMLGTAIGHLYWARSLLCSPLLLPCGTGRNAKKQLLGLTLRVTKWTTSLLQLMGDPHRIRRCWRYLITCSSSCMQGTAANARTAHLIWVWRS